MHLSFCWLVQGSEVAAAGTPSSLHRWSRALAGWSMVSTVGERWERPRMVFTKSPQEAAAAHCWDKLRTNMPSRSFRSVVVLMGVLLFLSLGVRAAGPDAGLLPDELGLRAGGHACSDGFGPGCEALAETCVAGAGTEGLELVGLDTALGPYSRGGRDGSREGRRLEAAGGGVAAATHSSEGFATPHSVMRAWSFVTTERG